MHMNGRVYDPIIGRFMAADPVTEAPFSSQGWNRYSYVGNSPVNHTDPSGYCFMGCFWNKALQGIGKLFRKFPILGTILKIAAGFVCGPAAIICAAAASGFVAGVTSGSWSAALRAGLISAATAIAFYGVGEMTGHAPAFGTADYIVNVAGHAGVGCLSAVASGGKCGPGALSAAVGAAASPFMNTGSRIGNITATAVVGGLASVAGGGKFAEGAATAAFGYMFNNDARAWSGGDEAERRDFCRTSPKHCSLDASGRTNDASWVMDVLAGGASIGASAATRAVGTTTLYRAVGDAELGQLMSSGAFRNVAGLEGKYFATDLASAQSYAGQASAAFGESYTIVSTRVPSSIVGGLERFVVDRNVSSVIVPTSQLRLLGPPRVVGR